MTIHLNGEQREIPDGLTLTGLIEWLELPADRVAVERNLEVVKKADWNKTQIGDGDRLEIVRMVGGGAAGCLPTGSKDFPCIQR